MLKALLALFQEECRRSPNLEVLVPKEAKVVYLKNGGADP